MWIIGIQDGRIVRARPKLQAGVACVQFSLAVAEAARIAPIKTESPNSGCGRSGRRARIGTRQHRGRRANARSNS